MHASPAVLTLCPSPAVHAAASVAPVRAQLPQRAARLVAKAQAERADESALNRRTVMGAGMAMAAAAQLPQLSFPSAAMAQPVSSDWELVRPSIAHHTTRHSLVEAPWAPADACPYVCLQVDLPLDKGVVLLDIGFTDTDPLHGAWGAHSSVGAACMGMTGGWL